MPSASALQRLIEKKLATLRQATAQFCKPAATQIIEQYGKDPYLILISCILSLRTKDTVSLPASIRLFRHARTPEAMLQVPLSVIERAIYPCGFYRTKAKTIHAISADLIDRFAGQVPADRQSLLTFNGVGPKTANLVLSEAFDIPAICVDTHVHRISNRLGIVSTNTPEQTEAALKKIVPPQYWGEWSRLLVMWGQNVCVPISPKCSTCPLLPACKRVGVTRSR
jgi:endonuclease III